MFVEPPWGEPVDVEGTLAAIPERAVIAGMFFIALAEGSEQRNSGLEFPRPRYLPFSFYPVSEFVPLLVEAARRFHPDSSLRHGLRRIGHRAPLAFLESTLGRVTLGAAEGVEAAVSAIASTYAINLKPSHCEVVQTSARSILLALKDIPYFLDSHHVGVFEGTLAFAGVSGTVKIDSHTARSADLLLEWVPSR